MDKTSLPFVIQTMRAGRRGCASAGVDELGVLPKRAGNPSEHRETLRIDNPHGKRVSYPCKKASDNNIFF
jgi:hypothetical protein